jgi:hypothetical protein
MQLRYVTALATSAGKGTVAAKLALMASPALRDVLLYAAGTHHVLSLHTDQAVLAVAPLKQVLDCSGTCVWLDDMYLALCAPPQVDWNLQVG